MIIPQSLIMTLFSADKAYSIPLAATIGLPLYSNDSSALPLLKSLINSGSGQGVVLAFKKVINKLLSAISLPPHLYICFQFKLNVN
jgi:uncharacterized membrane protein YraQ (UPF0718 family)